MRFSNSFLDEIRDRVPISQIVGARVTFDKRKTNAAKGDYWACCPFHGEKTPSFHCEDRKGRYHCFGCGASGDHFRFLTELDGLSFPEAVRQVAELAGVPLPALNPETVRREREYSDLTDVMDLAAQYFQDCLHGQEGAQARAYLRGRGISAATQQTFRIGYAPDRRNGLKEFLAGKGVSKEQLEACGLVVSGPDIPVSFDRFRGRIMFPIEDTRGKVIAFGGRALASDVPAKYLNSPDTELFQKGKVLYNHSTARKASRQGTVIAVEGYMDVIALAQADIEQAVAPLGTALTEHQLELLWRMTGEPVLCFDGDEAGLRAAWRAADLALPLIRPGRSLRFALLQEGMDPDDLVREAGKEAIDSLIATARPLADLLWMRETGGRSFDTPERRAELEKSLQTLASSIRDESVRRHYMQEFRERAESYFGSVPSRRRGGTPKPPRSRGREAARRLPVSESLARSPLLNAGGGVMPLREAALIVAVANHPVLLDEFFDAIEKLVLESNDLRRLRAGILDGFAHGMKLEREAVRTAIAAAGLNEIFERAEALMRRANQWPALPEAAIEDAREAFIQALHLHLSAGSLNRELKAAERALAENPTEENYRHLVEIQTELRNVQAAEALIEGFGLLSGRTRQS